MFKIDDVLWSIKPSKNGEYESMPQPSDFEVETEDLDAGSYRAIDSGDLIDNVVSINWSKCIFTFEAMTFDDAKTLLTKVSVNPIYAKIENPIWSVGYVEAEFRCSRKKMKKVKSQENRYDVSFNLVQKDKIEGM